MTQERLALGLRGENLACDTLLDRGYAIVTRRYSTKHGEIDIVARDGETLVFVEVKTRHDSSFGDPEEAVTLRKQQRLVWMAMDYLVRHNVGEIECRFDVVGINTSSTPPHVTIITDAFRPGW